MGFVQSTSVLLIGLSWGFASAAAQDGEGLRVFVHSTAAQETVDLAEPEASHIVERAGLSLIWRNCSPGDPCEAASDARYLVLLIVKETGKSGLGCSFVSQAGGQKAIIGLGNIERLSALSKISKSQILAAVIAHEIGHLLLGPAHTQTGIMHGNWDVHDLCRLEQRQLKFDPDQCRRIHAAVLARSRPEHTLLAARMP